MNYRHAFHAGNFADVVKHAVLARILLHLRTKPAAFRIIDTHAGAGLYDLTGPAASRSLEWQRGIHRLLTMPMAANVRALLAPYLDVIAALNTADKLAVYPGSPAIVRAYLRTQDRFIACELEPGAAAALARDLGRDRRIKVIEIDGFVGLNAYVPPPERRGLVLIDPPYERDDDFATLAQSVTAAHRKWATGIYLLWYPIKGRAEPDALARRLVRSGIGKILRAEIEVAPTSQNDRLGGCGLITINPPWTLEADLKVLLPALAAILSAPGKGIHRLDWLAAEA
jgi:23S rRNA (adenine2030-N6)-methyltransferase